MWQGLDNNTLSVILVGDVNLRNVTDPNLPFALVQDTFDAADVRFANCESCYADPTVEIPYKRGWFHANRSAAEGLGVAGFDAMGCANNVNFGAEAILESLSHLDRLGIAHAGAGKNRKAARTPAIVENQGVRFGLLSYTSVFWPTGHAAEAGQPGVATIKGHTAYQPGPRALEMPGADPIIHSWPDAEALAAMQEDIQALRSQVDILILSCHWGISGSQQIADYQTAIGHAAIDVGADLVFGHHPHVPQGVEVYKNKAIFYSLGNFMFGWGKRKASNPEGLLIHCAVKEKMLTKVSFAPILRNEKGQPQIVSTESQEGAPIVENIGVLSKPLGTSFEITPHEVIVCAQGC